MRKRPSEDGRGGSDDEHARQRDAEGVVGDFEDFVGIIRRQNVFVVVVEV